ncbi:MAG: hypothetical protein STSR0008_01980 [Ignavibacterium sp.]
MNRKTNLFFAFLFLVLILGYSNTYADVYPFDIRVTQSFNEEPFDGDFSDGTAAAIRFRIPDSVAVTNVTVEILQGMNLIKQITAEGLKGGDNFVIWDGSTEQGEPAPVGSYDIRITTQQPVGHSEYTLVYNSDFDTTAVGLSTRGVTVITDPERRDFGFAYGVNNGGGANAWGFVGLGRVAMTGELYGNTYGNPYVATTGEELGIKNRRYSPMIDEDGYLYVVGRDENRILRLYLDTLNTTLNTTFFTDSIPSAGDPMDVEVYDKGDNKIMFIATTTQILYAPIGNAAYYSGPFYPLLDTLSGMTFWDVHAIAHEDTSLFVVVRSSLPDIGDAVYKFKIHNQQPVTWADTVWGVHFPDGDAISLDMKYGETANDDILYLTVDKAGAATDSSGIYAITNLASTTPNKQLAFFDPDNNTSSTRGEVAVDAGGNLIYFENSNEQIYVVAPPTGPNQFSLNALDPVNISKSGVAGVIPIAQAKIDENNDGKPDKLGEYVFVSGVVNSINFTASANRFSYTIQDETGGVNITKSSQPGGGPVYNTGDLLQVKGKVGQFRGLTQLEIDSLEIDILKLDSNKTITPIQTTINDYLNNAEAYESMLIKINGVSKTSNSPAWPNPNADANMKIWDGGPDTLVLRIDKDSDVDDSSEVVWPVNILGIATQYSSANTAYFDGYQIQPRFYSDFTQNVSVPPSPYFHLFYPDNGDTITVIDSTQSFTANWYPAVDLNNDALIYQFALLKTPPFTSAALNDTFYTFTGTQVLGWLGASDTLVTKWTAKAKGKETAIISSVDTFSITFINDIGTDIRDVNVLPTDYYVDQNYPNPFNPSTTIRFGLPQQAKVDLRIFDILGQEVAVLVNNQIYEAGNHKVNFNASKLATGVYIYKLQTDNKTFIKKMMLLK